MHRLRTYGIEEMEEVPKSLLIDNAMPRDIMATPIIIIEYLRIISLVFMNTPKNQIKKIKSLA